ncbi:hypothetical protein VTG60DRAFT_5926 [Thermothelomyces hinnuleus]
MYIHTYIHTGSHAGGRQFGGAAIGRGWRVSELNQGQERLHKVSCRRHQKQAPWHTQSPSELSEVLCCPLACPLFSLLAPHPPNTHTHTHTHIYTAKVTRPTRGTKKGNKKKKRREEKKRQDGRRLVSPSPAVRHQGDRRRRRLRRAGGGDRVRPQGALGDAPGEGGEHGRDHAHRRHHQLRPQRVQGV